MAPVPWVPPASTAARPPLGSCILATGDPYRGPPFPAKRARVCLLSLGLPLQAPTWPPSFTPRPPSPAPDAGLSLAPRLPLKPQGDTPPALPPRPEDALPDPALSELVLSRGHFLPRTLSPSPTFPRAQLSKQLCASTLHTFRARSARPRLSAAALSPSPRLGPGPPPPTPPRRKGSQGPAGKCSVSPAHTQPHRRLQADGTPFRGQLVLLISTSSPHLLRALPAQDPAQRARLTESRNKSFPLPSCILHHVSAVCHVKSWQGLDPRRRHTFGADLSDTHTPPTAHTGMHTDPTGTHTSCAGMP